MRGKRAGLVLVVALASFAGSPGRAAPETPPSSDEPTPRARRSGLRATRCGPPSIRPLTRCTAPGRSSGRTRAEPPSPSSWFPPLPQRVQEPGVVFRMRAPIPEVFRGSTIPAAWGAMDVKKLVLVDGEARTDLLDAFTKGKHVGRRRTTRPRPRSRSPAPSSPATHYAGDGVGRICSPPSSSARVTTAASTWLGKWFRTFARLEDDGHFAHFPFHHLGESRPHRPL